MHCVTVLCHRQKMADLVEWISKTANLTLLFSDLVITLVLRSVNNHGCFQLWIMSTTIALSLNYSHRWHSQPRHTAGPYQGDQQRRQQHRPLDQENDKHQERTKKLTNWDVGLTNFLLHLHIFDNLLFIKITPISEQSIQWKQQPIILTSNFAVCTSKIMQNAPPLMVLCNRKHRK